MNSYILVAFGGAIGAMMRFGISELLENEPFPQATLVVNLVGSFFIGICFAATAHSTLGFEASLFLVTGILGAFTTMSAFSLETIQLIEQNMWSSAIPYVLITMLCCPLMALVGLKLGSNVLPS
jgi:CrcB protein